MNNHKYTIELKCKTFTFLSGDILTVNKHGRTYTHTSQGKNLGSVSFGIVMEMKGNLKQTCPYPLTFEVI